MFLTVDLLRPRLVSPVYPPYHRGKFLEEYFCDQFYRTPSPNSRKYIDVFWTNLFCNAAFGGRQYEGVQEHLNQCLDPDGEYFTVCQLDDGPLEYLPANTIIFSAGGNRKVGNIVPIPLVCSRIPAELMPPKRERFFASFLGSDTHWIRRAVFDVCASLKGYFVQLEPWRVDVPHQALLNYLEISASSRFVLCPRGYGTTSFRLYETFQLGAVPVYISDDHSLPWTDELDWNEFCVIVSGKDLAHLDELLRSITDENVETMRRRGKEVYEQYFTLPAVFCQIMARL